MKRNLKIFWVLLVSLGLVGLMGGSSLVMASPSHVTHFTSDKGPKLPQDESGCLKCHAPGTDQCGTDAPLFRNLANPDGLPLSLADTEVCDECHSPGGAFNGVGEIPPNPDNPDPNWEANNPDSVAYGAKYNWKYGDGVYNSDYEVLPFWKADTYYEPGDIVKRKIDEVIYWYVCIARVPFTSESSESSPNIANWERIHKWKPKTGYYTGDLVRGYGKVWRSRQGSPLNFLPDPVFTSGISPKLENWEWVKRTGAGKESLKTGKEKWCAGCHDRNLDDPDTTTSDAKIGGVYAPGVAGNIKDATIGVDGTSYGFYYNGHGKQWPNRPGLEIHCLDCHNSTYTHIDRKHRTYEVQRKTYHRVMHSYKDSYRLKVGLIIPRYLKDNTPHEIVPETFSLCLEACHDLDPEPHTTLYSPKEYLLTNFRDRGKGIPGHIRHLTLVPWGSGYSSDWCCPNDYQYNSLDSCVTCHNVHGSPSPVMTRHGELISQQGTLDKVPAMDYRWYKSWDDKSKTGIETFDLYESRVIKIDESLTERSICGTCHKLSSWSPYYFRYPGGSGAITQLVDTDTPPDIHGKSTKKPYLWVSDWDDVEKACFKPGDDIRYHLDFYVLGPFKSKERESIYDLWLETKLINPIKGINWGSGGWGLTTTGGGDIWKHQIHIRPGMAVARGEHHLHKDFTIPEDADKGEAHFRMDLDLYGTKEDIKGIRRKVGILDDEAPVRIDFKIGPDPDDPECSESP